MTKFEFDITSATAILESQHLAREEMLVTSRKVIQLASKSIRSTHRKELDKAKELNTQAKELLDSSAENMDQFPAIAANSIYYDAQKEYTEACVTLAIISRYPIPTCSDLEVDAAAYINGIVEAASELRRSVLDCLRNDEFAQAEELLDVMDDVYSLVVTVDYPDALTHGLRRTTDTYRAVLERTRGDVTTAVVFNKARP